MQKQSVEGSLDRRLGGRVVLPRPDSSFATNELEEGGGTLICLAVQCSAVCALASTANASAISISKMHQLERGSEVAVAEGGRLSPMSSLLSARGRSRGG